MSVEEELSKLTPLDVEPTKTQLKKRTKELERISKMISVLEKRLDAEYDMVRSMCDHSDSYSSNWCGRDPGGGGCNTCGESW